MRLKQQLKLYISSNGWTAAKLAREAGVKPQTLADWLSGRHPRRLDQLKRVADVLKTTVDNLLFGDEIRTEAALAPHLDSIVEGQWVSGIFEVRLRKIRDTKGVLDEGDE